MTEKTDSQRHQAQTAETTFLIMAAIMAAVVAIACVIWSNITMAIVLGLLSVMMILLLLNQGRSK